MTGALGKDLLGLESLTGDQIRLILDTAEPFKEISERAIKKVPALRGSTIVNLFFENSTRTRISFEFAEKRLSADTVNVSASGSSVSKGETLVDTARNLEAMRIDMVVIRHSASGAAKFLADRIQSNVINAGDGTHEHPTQGLLDILTLRDRFGQLKGRRICICGDILHSRVARSNIWGLTKLGAEVFERVEPAVADADVVMMLRIQLERLGGAGLFPNTREYSRYFGLGPRLAATLKPDAIVMHPGPINRGVELDPAIADGNRSVILDQVTYGVAVRMALLYLVAGGGEA